MLDRMDIENLERGERYAHLFALELRGVIESRQSTISAVAQAIGTKPSTLSRYFNLHREIPVSTANDICEELRVDIGMVADRAYDRLIEEMGAVREPDAEIVSLYTPREGIPRIDVAAKEMRGWKDETDQ